MSLLLLLLTFLACSFEDAPTEPADDLAGTSVCLSIEGVERRWDFTDDEFFYTAIIGDDDPFLQSGTWGYQTPTSIWIHSTLRNGEEIDLVNVYPYAIVGGIQVDIGGRSYRYCD